MMMMTRKHGDERSFALKVRPVLLAALTMALLLVPRASPFPIGVTASLTNAINTRKIVPEGPLQQQAPTTPTNYRTGSHLAQHMATRADATIGSKKKWTRFSIQQFVRFVKGKGGPKEERWKGGEATASLPSRLLFR